MNNMKVKTTIVKHKLKSSYIQIDKNPTSYWEVPFYEWHRKSCISFLDAIASVELHMSVTQSVNDHLSKSSSVYGLKHKEMF